jgi:hypothetical protein
MRSVEFHSLQSERTGGVATLDNCIGITTDFPQSLCTSSSIVPIILRSEVTKLTPRSRILLEKLIVALLLKEFPEILGNPSVRKSNHLASLVILFLKDAF